MDQPRLIGIGGPDVSAPDDIGHIDIANLAVEAAKCLAISGREPGVPESATGRDSSQRVDQQRRIMGVFQIQQALGRTQRASEAFSGIQPIVVDG